MRWLMIFACCWEHYHLMLPPWNAKIMLFPNWTWTHQELYNEYRKSLDTICCPRQHSNPHTVHYHRHIGWIWWKIILKEFLYQFCMTILKAWQNSTVTKVKTDSVFLPPAVKTNCWLGFESSHAMTLLMFSELTSQHLLTTPICTIGHSCSWYTNHSVR